MEPRYTKKDHKRAFELFREIGSLYGVSQVKGMPSPATLMRWSRPGFRCACGFHGWQELEEQIRRDARRIWQEEREKAGETDEKVFPDLAEYVLSDLKKLQINRVIEKKAFDAIQEGGAEAPQTLAEAAKIIHAGWRSDSEILGYPTNRVELTMSPREWREYILALAEQEQAKHETPEDNQ